MDRSLWKRAGVMLILLAGAACALASCGKAVAGADLPATSPTPIVTPSPAPDENSTPTPTLTTYSPHCVASQLGLQASFGGAAMGKALIRYQFTNTSTTACSLRGYVGARMPGHMMTIKQVTTSYMWLNVPVNTIEMAPGASGYFAIQTQDAPEQPGQTCATGALSIYPPHGVAGFSTSFRVTSCDGILYISPIVADQSEL